MLLRQCEYERGIGAQRLDIRFAPMPQGSACPCCSSLPLRRAGDFLLTRIDSRAGSLEGLRSGRFRVTFLQALDAKRPSRDRTANLS
jgi:hypothetical protein